MRGVGNIVFGVIAILGGLSGTLVMRGTGSGLLLALAGAVFLVMGFVQAAGGEPTNQAEDDASRDSDQMAEYHRSMAKVAEQQRVAADRAAQEKELADLLAQTPGAAAQIDALVATVGPHLDERQKLQLKLDTARRLHAVKPS